MSGSKGELLMIEIGPNLMKATIETSGNVAGVSVVAILAVLMYKLISGELGK